MSDHPTVLLVPGLLCDATVFESTIAALEGTRDVRAADLSTQDSLTTMAEDLLAGNEGPLSVVGHSMGARVAMEMARLAPERVVRLALLDTGIHPLKEGETEKRAEIVAFAHENGMSALADRWLPGMVHPARHGDTALMGKLKRMVEARDADLHERQIRALVDRPDASAYLAHITCPTLLLVGRQDAWSPVSQHEDMHALLPSSRLVVIEDAGHFAPVEKPDEVAGILRDWVLED